MTKNTEDYDLTMHAKLDRSIPVDGELQSPSTTTIRARQKLIDDGPPLTGNPPYRLTLWVDRTTPKTFEPRALSKSALGENR
jgi:hypothetical protein